MGAPGPGRFGQSRATSPILRAATLFRTKGNSMTLSLRAWLTTLAVALIATASAPAWADTVIVNENFDGYADTNAFLAAWPDVIGNGSAAANAADHLAGILTNDPLSNPANFPGVQGLAVDHVGATASAPGEVNQRGGI